MPRGDPAIRNHAAKGGRRSGKVRKRLTIDEVEAAFGQLETLEDAQRRLERLSVWSAAGLLAGSVAGAAVRAVEVWIRAHESGLTADVVGQLKNEVQRLKAEAKAQGLRAVR